jgi:hypothetical protein
MIHLQHYKDPEGVVSIHETKEDAEEYMSHWGWCYTHADSCPCDECGKRRYQDYTSNPFEE